MRRAALLLVLAGLPGIRPALAGPPDGSVRVTGVVLVAGVRTPGVRVEVRRRPGAPPAFPHRTANPDALHPERSVESPLPEGAPVATARTDEAGRFAFDGLAPGRFVILATAREGIRGWGEVVALQAGSWVSVEIPVAAGPHEVRGRARYRDGSPFRGLVVLSLGPYPWNDEGFVVEGAAVTDAEGRFEVRGLVPGFAEITVVDPGRLRASLGPVRCPHEGPLELVVDERLGVTVGRIVGPDGGPVAGVRVVARGDGAEGPGWEAATVAAAARTDEEGRFRLHGPLDPEFRVVARDRWLPLAEPLGPVDTDLVLVARPRPRLRGVVRRAEDGAPVAGVPIVAASRERGTPTATAVSDGEGRFDLAAPGTLVEFAAWGRGWVPRDYSERALTLRLEPGESRELAPEVKPAARLSGRVIDSAGDPVAGAEVVLGFHILELMGRGSSANWILSGFPPPVTDAEGRFRIDCLPVGGKVRSTVLAPGLGEGKGEFQGGPEEKITVTLGAAAERPSASRWTAVVRPLLPPGATAGDLCPPSEAHTVEVDGRIRFYPGTTRTVRIAGWFGEVFHMAEVELAPGDEREVTLEPAPAERAWLVRVVDPEGRPVPRGRGRFIGVQGGYRSVCRIDGGRVMHYEEPGPGDGKAPGLLVELHSFRDERGRPLPYSPKRAGPLPPGVSTVRLEPGRIVEAVVATVGGRPVRGAWVTAQTAPDEPHGRRSVHAAARTGVDGRCRLIGLGPTAYEIWVRTPLAHVAPAPTRVDAEADRVMVRVVSKVASRVRVVGPAGEPVTGARVRLDAPGEWEPFEEGRLERKTGEDGVAVFPLLPPDLPVALRVTPAAGDFLPYADWDWRPGHATIRLARALSLSGAVIDAAGRAVPDATVFVRPAEGAPPLPGGFSFDRIEGGFALAAVTDADGRFEIRGLPETRLQVFAARVHDDGAEDRSPAVAAPAGASGLLLRLP